MIYVIDDDKIMRECIARACGEGVDVWEFANAIEAMAALGEAGEAESRNATNVAKLPEMIFLDILLTGPDGFTFLNELRSYTDTAKIPVVIVSSLDLAGRDLSHYGVVGVLAKEKMQPKDVRGYVQKYVTK